MKINLINWALALWMTTISAAQAQTTAGTVPVTVDNFTRAESDLYLGNIVKDGGFGKLSIVVNPHQSTTRLSSVSIVTRFTRRECLTSMPVQ